MASTTRTPPTALTTTDIGSIVRKHWMWIVGSALAGALLGVAATFALPAVYTGTAEVLVSPLVTDTGDVVNGRTTSDVNLDTEVQIASSLEVAERTQQELDWADSPVEIASRLRVSVPANTSVLSMTFSAPTPQEAQIGANTYANAYLDNRASVDSQARRQQIAVINARLAKLTNSASSTADTQIEALRAQRENLANIVNSPGRVIAQAQLAGSPESPSKSVFAVAGFVLGLILGSIVAFLRWRGNEMLSTRRDVERAANAAVVADLPTEHDIIRSRQDHDRWQRGIRTLSLGLVGASGTVRVQSVAVLSIGCDTGGVLAEDLASTIRMRGLRCAVHRLRPPAPDEGQPEGIARDSWEELRRMRAENDVVIVSAAELPTALDLLEGAQLADAAILTVRLGTRSTTTLRQVSGGLEQIDVGLVGIVTVSGEDAPDPVKVLAATSA